MRHRPDDVLGTKRGVATEKYLWIRRSHGRGVDLRHVPFIELDATIALDPGEGILLADRNQPVIARNGLVGLTCRYQIAFALGVTLGFHLLKGDAGELAVVVGERDRDQEVED